MKRFYSTIILLLLLSGSLTASADEARITHFDDRDGFTESYITAVMQDSEGFIWVSSWNGLSRYDGYRFETFKGRPGDGCPLETNRINGIAELRNHDILCKSNEKYYVFRRADKTFSLIDGRRYSRIIRLFHPRKDVKERIMALPEYKDIEVKFLCTDRQGGTWIQSNRGLERVWFVARPITPEKYGSEGEESVRGLFRDSHGRVWIADKNGVVRVYQSIEKGVPILQQKPLFLASDGRLTPVPSVFGGNVYTFCEDKWGNIWLGCKPGGLYELRKTGTGYSIIHYLYNKDDIWSISDDNIYDIKCTQGGLLLVATYKGGLNIVESGKDGNVRFISPRNVLSQYPKEAMKSRCLLLLEDGTLLIGSTDGLVTCRLGTIAKSIKFYLNRRQPEQASALSSNYIMGMMLTRSGDVLVATSGGGIDKIDSRNLLADNLHFTHFSSLDGLTSDMTLALAEDPAGNVWVVSETSLSRVDPKKKEVVNYKRGFFTGRLAFTEVPPLCLPDGTMIAGTTQGTLAFNALDIEKSRFVPNIVFSCGNELVIDGGKKDFDVRFAALDYNKNEEIVYAYKLEGIDNEWHYTTTNELHYVGLQPGDYKLHVRSTNGDGLWTANESTVSIHRKAMFNETPWFWMLLGLIAAVILYIIDKVTKYIQSLQKEIKDIRLTSNEKIALLGDRIRELLQISESVERAETGKAEENLSNADWEFADKLKDFIMRNISNSDLSVQELASELFVSRTVLFTRVKRIFGCSPNNLILNMRIDYAKHMLGKDGLLVADVAYRCGFSDPKYFSRCFKKLTGKKPTDYR